MPLSHLGPAPKFESKSRPALALWLAGPIAAIFVILTGTAVWTGWHAASRIDAIGAQTETRLARTAFSVAVDPMLRVSQDYSFWDDTYDNTKAKFDLQWTEENLGPYLATTYAVTHTFVYDQKGELLYGSVPAGEGQKQYLAGLNPELAGFAAPALSLAAVSALLAAGEGDFAGKSGYLTYRGQLAFFVARAIRPSSQERMEKEKPVRVLGLVKAFAPQDFAAMSAAFGLTDLRIVGDAPVSLSRLDAQDPPIGVAWKKGDAGAKFISEGEKVLLPVAFASLILLLLTSIVWYRALSAVREAEFQALSERAKSVQETARAKSLFIANMSHELRTPLNAVIGFSELIKGQFLGPINVPKYAEYAADIYASGNHLLGIVNNILTLSKLEAQQQRIEIADVSLPAVVSDAMRMVAPDAAKRQIQIDSKIAGAPLARADAQALTQIAVNLLSNAVKFSETGAVVHVEVCVAPDGRDVQLIVTDTGCGIPADTLAQLGRPFTQAEDPFRRNYQGTGLGLSICFALAQQMNGRIQVSSEPGQGTRVAVSLPAATAATEDAATAPAQHAA